MNVFVKLSPIVQILVIVCVSGIVVVAMINQVAGAALIALVGAMITILRKGSTPGE